MSKLKVFFHNRGAQGRGIFVLLGVWHSGQSQRSLAGSDNGASPASTQPKCVSKAIGVPVGRPCKIAICRYQRGDSIPCKWWYDDVEIWQAIDCCEELWVMPSSVLDNRRVPSLCRHTTSLQVVFARSLMAVLVITSLGGQWFQWFLWHEWRSCNVYCSRQDGVEYTCWVNSCCV